jgi:Xaa-Pro aminopeptidase
VSSRVDRLRELLEEPLLVSSPSNVRYLVGLDSSNAALVVEPERVRLFTDFRYLEAARSVPGVELVQTRRDLFGHLGELLTGRIAFEAADLTYRRYEAIAAGGVELVPRDGLVEGLRAIKDEGELAAIRKAATITDEAFAAMAGTEFVGRSERALAWELEQRLHERGAEGTAFQVIVASGPSSALPHARPTDRLVGEGEAVIVDAGCRIDGYCSDCTRTFATGRLPGALETAYEVCRRAEEVGVAELRPGRRGADVDRAARDVIDEAGLGEHFGHGLGHGVGLEVHERPWLNPELDGTLSSGNVVTVEPGIYLPGLGGVRVEDLAVVTESGAEVLSSVTKELVRVH